MRTSPLLLAVGVVAGAFLDVSTLRSPHPEPGRPLVADLHVHSFLGDGALSAPHLLLEARRRGLDAIAVTNHNQVVVARATSALSRLIGGPIVIVGEEITSPGWHLIGVGLQRTVGWRQSLPEAIAAVHAQGGAAILAHPTSRYWPAISDDALRTLDGSEVGHPAAEHSPRSAAELIQLFHRGRLRNPSLAAIGSSDDHGLGGLGSHRTYVFAAEASVAGIVQALRAGRTVVEENGRRHGEPDLIAALPNPGPASPRPSTLLVGLCGWVGVVGMLFLAPGSAGGRASS
jgi:PHP-associated